MEEDEEEEEEEEEDDDDEEEEDDAMVCPASFLLVCDSGNRVVFNMAIFSSVFLQNGRVFLPMPHPDRGRFIPD